MLLYQNLTIFVEMNIKVKQLISIKIHFLAQKSWPFENMITPESFKTIFACEWTVVTSEFKF